MVFNSPWVADPRSRSAAVPSPALADQAQAEVHLEQEVTKNPDPLGMADELARMAISAEPAPEQGESSRRSSESPPADTPDAITAVNDPAVLEALARSVR